jgi:hypothetical protein
MNITFMIQVDNYISAGRLEKLCKKLNLKYETTNTILDNLEPTEKNSKMLKFFEPKVEQIVEQKIDPSKIKVPPVAKAEQTSRTSEAKKNYTTYMTKEYENTIIDGIRKEIPNKHSTQDSLLRAVQHNCNVLFSHVRIVLIKYEDIYWERFGASTLKYRFIESPKPQIPQKKIKRNFVCLNHPKKVIKFIKNRTDEPVLMRDTVNELMKEFKISSYTAERFLKKFNNIHWIMDKNEKNRIQIISI